jgi:hypothetical protein
MSLKCDGGSDMSDNLSLDNLSLSGQKYSTSSNIRIFIFIILNFHSCVHVPRLLVCIKASDFVCCCKFDVLQVTPKSRRPKQECKTRRRSIDCC